MTTPLKIGLYGGSFDPIHRGHLQPVAEALDRLGLDRVVYLPTARPPHKTRRELASPRARCTMVELALLAEPRMRVCDLELREDRISYTVDTLEHFRSRHPEARLFLVLGHDSFVQLPAWRRWRDVLALAELAVLERPGEPRPVPAELARELDEDRVHRVANAPVDASSTHVRRLLAARSADVERLVPRLVLDYIDKYDLYR